MLTISSTLAIVLISFVAYYSASLIWSVYFGGLSKIPGPKLAAATRFVLIRHKARGDAETWRLQLHRTYGDVVRVAPNEISFANGSAWKEIYGYAAGSKFAKCEKDPTFYAKQSPEVSLVVATGDDHIRQRKCFSHAFSDMALKEQVPLIERYVLQLISNIQKTTDEFDIVRQYNFTTFDIMADLAFGEPLGCLATSEYVSWVSMIFGALKVITIVTELNHYPYARRFLDAMIPPSMQKKKEQHLRFASDRVDKRLQKETRRSDVWHFVLASEDKGNQLSRKEMHVNAGLFMIAGSETTATLLSGLTFYLLANPEKMKRLTEEIRGRFSSAEQINVQDLFQLEYLTACIQEGLRIYPPVPIGLPRVVPKGGAEICGYVLPEGTSVYIHQLSTYHNPKNFVRPDEFLPQRWLSSSDSSGISNEKSPNSDAGEFARDDKFCCQPFLVGPRSCLGSSLAWLEIRLILAHVLWRFDLELRHDGDSRSWNQQKVFSLWDKGPLMVRATPVTR